MDWRARVKVVSALLVVASCATASKPTRTVLATGTLAYAVAASDQRIVSIELSERFELVVRKLDATGAITVERRIDLGPPDTTIGALALGDGVAFVGGRDGWIVSYDLATGAQRAKWPQGAPIMELHVGHDNVIARDRGNVECTRRIADGALLQCADVSQQQHDLPPVLNWGGGSITWHGHDLSVQTNTATVPLAHFGGEIRAATVTTDGALIVAAWIAQLADPSLVMWRPTSTPEK